VGEESRITIDGKRGSVPAGGTILEAARSLGIAIPAICYKPYCSANGLCRLCSVELEGARTLVAACVAKASDGMVVKSSSDRVIEARRSILEILAASVDLRDAPEILDLMKEYGAEASRFPGASRREGSLLDDNPMYVRDYSKCILCWRCVQVCGRDAQYTFAIGLRGRGFATGIGTFYGRGMPATTCVFCGQCVSACPTGALKPRREWKLEEAAP
jgi:NADP-reducing hydrogenase subunit HndD